jgi:hypothetical protein
MSGPAPAYQPAFPTAFVEHCQQLVRQRTIEYGQHQRAQLVLLFQESPLLSNTAAATAVALHPNSVRLWRQRWAQGNFSLDDQGGRGRKASFSPSRPSSCQSDCL